MDIKSGARTKPGRTRTVYPLADPKLIDPKGKFWDPEFKVTVLEESSRATGRRWDDHGWDPSNKKDKHYSEKMMVVGLAEVEDLVVSWDHLTNTDPPEDDNDPPLGEIPCEPKWRRLLVEVSVPTLDEEQPRKSLWRLTQLAIGKQIEAESGN